MSWETIENCEELQKSAICNEQNVPAEYYWREEDCKLPALCSDGQWWKHTRQAGLVEMNLAVGTVDRRKL